MKREVVRDRCLGQLALQRAFGAFEFLQSKS